MNNPYHNKGQTGRLLLSSLLSVVLCSICYLGSTWAWFTDTATVRVEGISAGTWVEQTAALEECSCEALCSDEVFDENCFLCSQDPAACEYSEPICSCEALCSSEEPGCHYCKVEGNSCGFIDQEDGTPTPETPVPEAPAPEEPAPGEPVPEAPAPEEPTPEEPAPEEPTPEEPAPEEPAPEEPAPEEPAPEEPTPEEPTPEEPTPEEPTPEEPAPEKPTPEEPAPEEPTPEEPEEKPETEE